MPTPRQALEAFVVQPELAQLEGLLSRFNLFEAIGVVRHELRHSDFLSYLLDPSRNHGVEAIFVKELLQSVLLTTEGNSTVSLFDLDFWNLGQSVVQREWHHIDILVIDDVNRFVVIIENKIDTSEHSDQLQRYYAEVSSHYAGYEIVALYLTPAGDAPSSDHYFAVSYSLICEVVEKLVQDRYSTLGSEVIMLMEHYAQMLRRHILSESEVAELCRRIYQKHRQALDLIFEHKPDQQDATSRFVKSLVEQQPELVLYHNSKSYTRFGLKDWNKTLLHSGQNSSTYSTLLHLQFDNIPNKLFLKLEIGPGDQEQRKKLHDMARKKSFRGFKSTLSPQWSRLFSCDCLKANDYDKSQEDIEALILKKWTAFLQDDLPQITQAIREEKWLWELP